MKQKGEKRSHKRSPHGLLIPLNFLFLPALIPHWRVKLEKKQKDTETGALPVGFATGNSALN